MSTAEPRNDDADLADYEPENNDGVAEAQPAAKLQQANEVKKGSYAGIHSSSFREFLLKPELLNAISDCGFEHPSEVQQECIPRAILGTDIICQAKSGMGKTAVFVLATLQQLEPEPGVVDTVVLTHTRELAFQICKEFERFSKHLPEIKNKIAVLFGGIPIQQHKKLLKDETPLIVVGTPGRVLALLEDKSLKIDKLKRFILDECDQMLESLDMRRDVQRIFRQTPHEKQVMMFSATLSKEIRPVCRKFTQDPIEIFVDDESKLTLHGLQQYFVKLREDQKNRKLNDILDALEFNQVVIFVNGVRRCKDLTKLLNEYNFPAVAMYGGLEQEQRIERYTHFKDYQSRILVSTDIFGRGVDFERVNVVINYDTPTMDPRSRDAGQGAPSSSTISPIEHAADQYLHRVGRSGRFGTKGLAITFVSSDEDSKVLEKIQERFEVNIPEMPDEIDVTSYMSS